MIALVPVDARDSGHIPAIIFRVLPVRDQAQIFDPVIQPVAVYVVNLKADGNVPVVHDPYQTMNFERGLLDLDFPVAVAID